MENSLSLEDLDFPGKRSDQARLLEIQSEDAGRRRRVVHGNSTPEFCLRSNLSKPQLQDICANNNIAFFSTNTIPQLSALLANKFSMENQVAENEEGTASNELPIDDCDAKIAFLHQMMPHCFMRPFVTAARGSIE